MQGRTSSSSSGVSPPDAASSKAQLFQHCHRDTPQTMRESLKGASTSDTGARDRESRQKQLTSSPLATSERDGPQGWPNMLATWAERSTPSSVPAKSWDGLQLRVSKQHIEEVLCKNACQRPGTKTDTAVPAAKFARTRPCDLEKGADTEVGGQCHCGLGAAQAKSFAKALQRQVGQARHRCSHSPSSLRTNNATDNQKR